MSTKPQDKGIAAETEWQEANRRYCDGCGTETAKLRAWRDPNPRFRSPMYLYLCRDCDAEIEDEPR